MKLFVFALIFAGVVYDAYADYYVDEKKCLASSGVNLELLNKSRSGENVERNEKLIDFYNCMMKTAGLQNEDGTFNEDLIVSKLPPAVDRDEGTKAATKCLAAVEGFEAREAAYKFCECFHAALPTSFVKKN